MMAGDERFGSAYFSTAAVWTSSVKSRRQGIATAFIERLEATGVEQNGFHIYWVTNQENVATRTGYVRYEIALGNNAH